MSGTPSPKQASSSGSSAAEEFIKIVQQIIDSDEDEIIAKRMGELKGMFPVLKSINGCMTNQQKLSHFMRDNLFKQRLAQKMKEKYSHREPILMVYLYSTRHNTPPCFLLDSADLQASFSHFGTILHIHALDGLAYIRYDGWASAYLAIQSLDSLEVAGDVRMGVRWPREEEYQEIQAIMRGGNAKGKAGGTNKKQMIRQVQKMLKDRYEIYIDPSPQFKLPHKIIGPGGSNMKNILSTISTRLSLPLSHLTSITKLRLRGRGSNFKEPPYQLEADEIMNLCVSCTEQVVIRQACKQVEQLLGRIGRDYKELYERKHKKVCEGVAYRKFQLRKHVFELTKQFNLEEMAPTLDVLDPLASSHSPLSQRQIEQIISDRARARKQGKFKEADLMRQMLKKQGICLVDEKEGNGRVRTVWKYQ